MTAIRLPQSPSLIPGPLPRVDPDALTGSTPYVVAAPYRPTTFFGVAGGVLGDVLLSAAVIVGLAMAPVLVVQAIVAAGSFILALFGRS